MPMGTSMLLNSAMSPAAAKAAEKEPVAPLLEPAATPADAPLKMNTPVVSTPSAMPLRARLAGTSVEAAAAAATEATQTPASQASASTSTTGSTPATAGPPSL